MIRSGEQTTIIERHAQIVTARFAPRGDAVAIQGWTDAVELWSIADGTLLRSFESPGGVGDLAFSADGERIAIGEIGHGGGRYVRHVFVYETATGRLLEQHGAHDWQISQVAFSPDGRRLASLGDEVILWELGASTPGRVIARIEVDRTTTTVRFLRDGRLLVVDAGRARVYRGDELLLGLDVPVGYQTPWCLGDDDRTLSVSINQGLARFDLETGEPRGVIQVPIPRPESLPSRPLAAHAEFRAGAALWRTEHGLFLHQSDGPRGWVEPLRIFGRLVERLVAIPTTSGAAIVELTPEPSLLGLVPFEGKLRASQVVGHEILLVNEAGRLFRSELPGGR